MTDMKAVPSQACPVPKRRLPVLRLLSFGVTVLLYILIALLLLCLITGKGANGTALGPFRAVTVLTPSMSPEILPGDLVIIEKAPEEAIGVGDIITFYPLDERNVLLTHRVVSRLEQESAYVPQGDANAVADNHPVAYEDVAGKVVFVASGFGDFLSFLSSPAGVVSIAAAIGAFLLVRLLLKKQPG